MGFRVSARQSGEVTIVDISGSIMSSEADALRELLTDLVDKGQKKILLNLENVSHLDSSGISVLVRTYTAIGKSGGQLKMLHLSKQLHHLLEVTNLSKVFEDYSDEETAVRNFS